MKVLHVITSLFTGGAEKLMVDLLPKLNANGVQADLYVMDSTRTPFMDRLEESGVKVLTGKPSWSYYHLGHIDRLRTLMKGYEIVHTHNTSPQLFAALASLGRNTKLVTTEHNTHNRRRDWKGYRAVDRWMYGRYSNIICISDKAETNLRSYLGDLEGSEICTIYNGVDVASIVNAKPDSEIKDVLPSGGVAVMMVAAFRKQKDQDTLIKAMKELPESYHLFLVGTGDRLEECKSLVRAVNLTDRIHFLGMRVNIPQLLKAADIVVLSSHYEGLSLSSVEGMASGHPFIASDVDGLHEVVNGAGVLFPQGDCHRLAEEIKSLMSDRQRYDECVSACVERAMRYDINNMAKNYLRIYR